MKRKNYVSIFEEICIILLLVGVLIINNQLGLDQKQNSDPQVKAYTIQRKDTTTTYHDYLKNGRLRIYDEFYDFDHIPGEDVHQFWLELLKSE